MLKFSAWAKNNEIKRLNKDAPLIIKYTKETVRPEKVPEVALLTRKHLDHAHSNFGTSEIGLKRTIDEYERLHKEARRQKDEISLTAFTLVLIYARSLNIGKDCSPAIKSIDSFISDYK